MEYLRATSDDEMGEIGPSPPASTPTRKDRVLGTPGCGENRAILRCHPRLGARHSLLTPPRLTRFSSATPPARKLIAGSTALAALPGRSMGKIRSSPIPSIYPVDSVFVPIEIPGFCRRRPIGKIVNHGDFRID
jgi:hypothetical protein